MTEFLLSQLQDKKILFKDVLAYIEERYAHTPTAFQNGTQANASTENQGSAKVLAFAKINGLSKEETLLLFAEHYADVLSSPDGSNHQNIRQFMVSGWDGVVFEGTALVAKSE